MTGCKWGLHDCNNGSMGSIRGKFLLPMNFIQKDPAAWTLCYSCGKYS